MAAMEILSGLTERHLSGIFAPNRHRRYNRRLRKGQPDKKSLTQAKNQWWGGDTHWFPAGTPPRQHNKVTPLIDGDDYFNTLLAQLNQAQHYIFITGWALTPWVPLKRDDTVSPEQLAESQLLTVLTRLAGRLPVRLLLWNGARFVFQPSTRLMRQVEELINTQAKKANVNMICRLDNTSHPTHCHHQKSVVIDGEIAYVGGIDLTNFKGDRWDTKNHSLRFGTNWHDIQVQIEGEAVADVAESFRQRWQVVTGDDSLPHRTPVSQPDWNTPVQVVRTIPRKVYKFARKGEYGIFHSYIEAIQQANQLIYIENQYLWSPQITDALIEKMNRKSSENLRVVIVLPARAHSSKGDNDEHIKKLRKADKDRGILSVYSLYAFGVGNGIAPFRYRPTYLHAKVAIIDDAWLLVGSANLNNRGLITDSEMNVVINDKELARQTRITLWAEHLSLPIEQVAATDPAHLIEQEWLRQAELNAEIIKEKTRPLVSALHRYEVGRMPGSWLIEEAEALTLEH